MPERIPVTGGVVYRGCAIPDLQGTYFFADYGSTNIWSLRYSNGGYTGFLNRNELETAAGGQGVDNISSFGTDANGEVYIADQSGGEIFKIIPASGDVSCETYPSGDINEDCLVDGTDLAIVLGQGRVKVETSMETVSPVAATSRSRRLGARPGD